MFRSIVFTAVIVGVITGCAVSLLHQFLTVPMILAAEVYEQGGADGVGTSSAHDHGAAEGASSAAPAATEQHHHDPEAWAPADGWQRTLSTSLADILTTIGYALVLTGLISFRGKPVDVYQGLLWGLCGFVAVVLAPGLGLPPELPGSPAGPLADRQIWWIATAVFTAAGMGLIAFVRQPWAPVLAVVLLVAPHLYGAPLAPEWHALVPEALSHRFAVMATVVGLLCWAMIGTLSAAVFRRLSVA